VELDLLFLVNDYHGDCELGTLFLERRARGGGRGRLLSFARLMLIASDPVRFGPKAMAEIRGFTHADGRSPFWDAVGAKFFRMDYRRADALSARDHRFIADLMPRYPVYVSLLPDEARSVIARPHPDAEPALAMLQAQGFRYNQVVDIFDAGPTVEAFIDHIDTVRETVRMPARKFIEGPRPAAGLAASPDATAFCVTQFCEADDPHEVIARIGVEADGDVSVYRLKASRP
jgi:arginine N-succinyltransferase